MRSYFEEFERKYEKPQVNDITIGFSGIDPAPKYEAGDVQEMLSQFDSVDCGEIT